MNSSSSPFRPKMGRSKEKDAVGWNFDFLERERAPSPQNSGRSDRQFSTEQEGKLFYAARATRGH